MPGGTAVNIVSMFVWRVTRFLFGACNTHTTVPRRCYQTAVYRKSAMASLIVPQKFDNFLILDFEATCQRGERIRPQEIIEFPVLKVSAQTFEMEAVFHQYVQPQVHPELTSFCTELTGIIQDMVNGQPNITETLQSLDSWMEQQQLKADLDKSVFVTCGDWDLKVMLPSQAQYFNFKYPEYLKKWINIKKPYSQVVGQYPRGLDSMLSGLGMKFQGRPHSGIVLSPEYSGKPKSIPYLSVPCRYSSAGHHQMIARILLAS